jgi:hypothetical protein
MRIPSFLGRSAIIHSDFARWQVAADAPIRAWKRREPVRRAWNAQSASRTLNRLRRAGKVI